MKRTTVSLALAVLAASLFPGSAGAQVHQGDPADLPVLSRPVPPGNGEYVATDGPAPVAKVVDGSTSDWVGELTRYGGTAVYSAGELVYQDHLFDAHGADDGRDARRFAQTDPVEEALPEAYRIDALAQADPAGEFGVPVPEEYSYDDTYGDARHQDRADLSEVRVAIGGDRLSLLARTTTMTGARDTALLVLADTVPGETARSIPFNTNLTTTTGDVAFFITDGVVLIAHLTSAAEPAPSSDAAAVADPSGWNNALEASLPLGAVAASDGSVSIAVASGNANGAGDGFAPLTLEVQDETADANVANVAFRFDEPVRTWFERQQALSLHSGTIDPFFLDVDTARLSSGESETFVPGPGYHDRIFHSDPSTGVPRENGRDGVLQHYGVFLPSAYDGEPVPLQWWLHWRGGNAHTAGSVIPKLFKQLGEDQGSIVVSPSGRGTGTWYNGRGHVDVQQVWADVFDTFTIDRSRVYVTGHSMGGWGSYLMTLLYPDRFAAAAPFAGPVTQGAWTGADFEGCDEFQFEEYTPCYISANESRPRDQHTRRLLDNALHVPYGIFHGTDDELVPYSGVARQAEQLVRLGYRHRFYTSPGYEHYTHPIADQWAEAGEYMHSFTAPENPSRVVYERDMPFERATEEVQSGGADLDFTFDSAYWMSGLNAVDETNGVATFDGHSLAIPAEPYEVVPDSDAPLAPGQTGPFVITGLQWIDNPVTSAPAAQNGFDITLTGARAVRLDVDRMQLDPAATIVGSVDTGHELALRLDGGWATAPAATVDGQPAATTFENGVLTITVPSGVHAIEIAPGDAGPQEVATNLAFTEDSAESGQYSDSATLSARLTDATGAPLAGEELSFALGSSSVTAVTDATGVGTATVPLNDRPGDSHVTVSFGGRVDELGASLATAPFVVEADDSNLVLTVTGKGSKRSLTATLTDADSGEALAGRTIVFQAGANEIGRAQTSETGTATIAVPSGYRGNEFVYRALFDGDGFYLASSDSSDS